MLALALFSVEATVALQSSPPTCSKFPASFLAIIDQTIDAPFAFIAADPDLTYFKKVLKFRENAIQHTFDDAISFFNETYGLDFSLSPPNDQNEYFYENAKMSGFKFADDIQYLVTLNNWIQTGNSRSTCYKMNDGGIIVTFSAEQTLHGSYGGNDGITVGPLNLLVYGFYSIEVCQQSPVIIQYQSGSPVRQEPVDGTIIINCDLYSQVLGYGKAQGISTITPSLVDPGKYRYITKNTFTFG